MLPALLVAGCGALLHHFITPSSSHTSDPGYLYSAFGRGLGNSSIFFLGQIIGLASKAVSPGLELADRNNFTD